MNFIILLDPIFSIFKTYYQASVVLGISNGIMFTLIGVYLTRLSHRYATENELFLTFSNAQSVIFGWFGSFYFLSMILTLI